MKKYYSATRKNIHTDYRWLFNVPRIHCIFWGQVLMWRYSLFWIFFL